MVERGTRTRRWTSKTRTGCRTCRIRRIKCDEARPQCKKCVHSGRRCDGYELLTRNGSKPGSAILLPRAAVVSTNPSSSTALQTLPHALDLMECQAFDFFRSHAVNSLSGHFSSSVFQYIVLQASHKDSTVLRAAIAVGSMYRTRVMVTQASFATINDCPTYKSALKQYNKAISNLAQYIERGKDQTEKLIVVLLTCLLFVCFEMLHGDQAVVVSHLVKGLKILFERSEALNAAVARKRILTIHDSSSDIVDTVSQVFVRLDADSTMFGRRAPYLCPRSFGHFVGTELDLPATFRTLEEARAHLDTLTSIAFAFRGELLKLAETDVQISNDEPIDWPRHYCLLHAAVRDIDLEVNPELAVKKYKILAAFKAWSEALDGLELNSRQQALLMLRIQKFYPWFIIATLQDKQACESDRFKETYQSVVDMVAQYVELTCYQSPDFAFALEPGITASLYLVGIKCRDPSLRRRAIGILSKSTVQEGLWNRRLFASYCQRIMDVEQHRAEEILGPGGSVTYIPEQARFSDVVFGIDSCDSSVGRLVGVRHALERDGVLEIYEDRFAIGM